MFYPKPKKCRKDEREIMNNIYKYYYMYLYDCYADYKRNNSNLQEPTTMSPPTIYKYILYKYKKEIYENAIYKQQLPHP